MSFWGWAVLTSQYLRNRLPTSTLPTNITPIEALCHKKPDLSHLRVWGCQCFVTIPPKFCTKAGPRCFDTIFIGYEDDHVGWTVHDLKGKVHFSQDVIFNEDLFSHLGIPRSPPLRIFWLYRFVPCVIVSERLLVGIMIKPYSSTISVLSPGTMAALQRLLLLL